MYEWLRDVTSPRVVVEAVKLLDVVEATGAADNPTILGWAKELNLDRIYTNDATAWCGLFAAVSVSRAGFDPVKDPLWARNWSSFGTKVTGPALLGDVLVFSRGTGGHVGFYIGDDETAYHVLGGNQSDRVKVARISKVRCIAVRRCPWKVSQPDSVRRIILSSEGSLSTNEA